MCFCKPLCILFTPIFSYCVLSCVLGIFGPQKAMEVCEICGAFLIVGDAQTRIGMAKISLQQSQKEGKNCWLNPRTF